MSLTMPQDMVSTINHRLLQECEMDYQPLEIELSTFYGKKAKKSKLKTLQKLQIEEIDDDDEKFIKWEDDHELLLNQEAMNNFACKYLGFEFLANFMKRRISRSANSDSSSVFNQVISSKHKICLKYLRKSLNDKFDEITGVLGSVHIVKKIVGSEILFSEAKRDISKKLLSIYFPEISNFMNSNYDQQLKMFEYIRQNVPLKSRIIGNDTRGLNDVPLNRRRLTFYERTIQKFKSKFQIHS